MSKRTLLILIGAWMMAFLFIGFPAEVDMFFAVMTGAIILIIGLKEQPRDRSATTSQKNTYVDHKKVDDISVVSSPETKTDA